MRRLAGDGGLDGSGQEHPPMIEVLISLPGREGFVADLMAVPAVADNVRVANVSYRVENVMHIIDPDKHFIEVKCVPTSVPPPPPVVIEPGRA